MYIYNFFNSLDLLNGILDIEELPIGDYLYFGIHDKQTLIENGFPIDSDNNYFLTYSKYNDLKNLKFSAVDAFYEYQKKLEAALIDLSNIDEEKLKIALFEAIWIINEISYLEEIPFFDAKLNIEIFTLVGMIDYNGDVYDHGLDYFENISLLKKIHIDQIRYFISQYVKSRLSLKTTQKNTDLDDFDQLMLDEMKNFINVGPDKYKVELYTGEANPEFDDIIEQIVVLTNMQSGEKVIKNI